MLYKPGFCCQCGEQIERVSWRLWTSRRFCALCETEFVLEEWALRVIPCIGLICGVLYFGSFFQSAANDPEAPRTLRQPETLIRPVNTATPVTPAAEPGNEAADSLKTETNLQRTTPNQNLTKIPAPDHSEAVTKQNTEPVYFCGAETKKKTPCSRRVKGGGRCWQHLGQEAMMPDEKLLINQ